jgi:hypothetical protein
LEFDHPSQSITFPPLSDASVAEDVAGEEETYPSEAAKRQED